MHDRPTIARPLRLPNGTILAHRMLKSAMSDGLGDGEGMPTPAQENLYARWADGGAAVSIVGEVQGSPDYPEAPGNLVLGPSVDLRRFAGLTRRGGSPTTRMWAQLGHAGVLSDPHISQPAGPSAITLPGRTSREMSTEEVRALPQAFAATAARAERAGFHGVQIHAAHGFLLSQFLSPLFNRRVDEYGGSAENRRRLLLEVVTAVRAAVDPGFDVALKLNSSDLIAGGFEVSDALAVIRVTADSGLDLIDISGGTYFPGATPVRLPPGPRFLDVARHARSLTSTPIMTTGGFRSRADADDAVRQGHVDAVGIARALVLRPDLAHRWLGGDTERIAFPRFTDPPEGAITDWFALRLGRLGAGDDPALPEDAAWAQQQMTHTRREQAERWRAAFPTAHKSD